MGVGYGRFPELSRGDPRVGSGLGQGTHNTYVEVLVEGGVITFSFFILHWLQYFPGFFVAVRVAADRRDSVIAASVVGLPDVLVCAALANMLLMYSFWAICGLTLAGLNVVKSELSRSSEGTRTLTAVQAPQGSA